jgi:hypothetical protein
MHLCLLCYITFSSRCIINMRISFISEFLTGETVPRQQIVMYKFGIRHA